MRAPLTQRLLLLAILLGASRLAEAGPPLMGLQEGFYPPGTGGGGITYEAWFGRAADLDGNGQDELITGRWVFGGDYSVLQIRHFGASPWMPSFVSSHVVGFGFAVTPGPCEVADLDGDGLLDLAVPVWDTLAILPGTGPGTFGPRVAIPMPGIGYVVSADLDDDDVRDLAITRLGDRDVQIWRGTGALTYSLTGSFPTHNFPADIAVVDLDENGFPDLVAAADTVSLALLGDGVGGFTPIDIAASRARPTGDLNGDGHEDLLTNSAVLLGHGDGTFAPALPFSPSAYRITEVTDLDEDGRPDLVAKVSASPRALFIVRRGLGDGQFGPIGFTTWSPTQPTTLVVGDFDGDGHADVAHPARNGEPDAVFFGLGNGRFHEPRRVALTSPPRHVVAGNLGGDAGPDLLVTSRVAKSMSVLLSNGLGSWAPPDTTLVPGTPGALRPALADLNDDGRDDIVLGYSDLPTISVWLTQPDGHPGPRTDLPIPFSNTAALQVVDLDQDLVPDILFIPAAGASGLDPIRWFRGLGGGGFASQAEVGLGARWCFVARDLSGDGIPDLAYPTSNHEVTVAIASSAGVFSPPVAYPWFGASPSLVPDKQILACDLDSDPYPDLVLHGTGGAVFLRGLGGGAFAATTGIGGEAVATDVVPSVAADMDGNGVDDLVSGFVLSGWLKVTRFAPGGALLAMSLQGVSPGAGGRALCVTDVDANGTPDIVSALSGEPVLDVLLNRTPPEVLDVRPPVAGPGGLGLQVLGNPTRGELRFRLSTTQGASVRVDLVDLQGRRVRTATVRPNAGAATSVSLGESASLPAGVYFARARQGAATATTRVGVLR